MTGREVTLRGPFFSVVDGVIPVSYRLRCAGKRATLERRSLSQRSRFWASAL